MADTRLGSTIGGRYTITDKLGQGGMSVVWLARDKRLERLQAVKEMKYDAANATHRIDVDLMRKEAHMMRNLDHPNIVHVNDIIDENNSLFVVMDYVPGKDLSKVMRENKEALQTGVFAFPEDDVIDWGIQLCQALGYLHEQDPPIIYRDMKPGNIMLQDDGQIKIIDFGIAREFKPNQQLDTTPLGTRGYASPEAVEKSSQTDARSDVYSLGVTLFHLVTGHSPLEYVTQPNLPPIRSINPDLSPALESILVKSNNWDPNLRQQSMAEMQWELQELPTPDMWVWMKKTFNTFKALTVAAGVCVVLGAGSLVASRIVRNQSFDGYLEGAKFANKREVDGQMSASEDLYMKAIGINPRDIEPYYHLVYDVYVSDRAFSTSEEGRWNKLLDTNQSYIRNARKKLDGVQGEVTYAEVCFWAGIDCQEYLETSEAVDENGKKYELGSNEWNDAQDEIMRGSRAAKMFARAVDAYNDFDELSTYEASLKQTSEDLRDIGEKVGELFGKGSANVPRGGEKKNTSEQWKTVNGLLNDVVSRAPDLETYEQLQLRIYHIAARLLGADAFVNGFCSAGVPQGELNGLVSKIENNAKSLPNNLHEEDEWQDVVEYCTRAKASIERVYNAHIKFTDVGESTGSDSSTSREEA